MSSASQTNAPKRRAIEPGLDKSSKKALRYALLGLGAIVALSALAVLALLLSGRAARRKVVFAIRGISDPFAILDQATPQGELIAYGPELKQFGELRVPAAGTNFPVAIILHGGCWKSQPGDVTSANSFALMRPLAAALTGQGIATWNVEYRRSGDAGGGWPGSYLDLSSATDSLASISAAKHLDLTRVVVIGHSSGGQLALWLAGRAKLPATSSLAGAARVHIRGVLDIDGPPSLEDSSSLDDQICGVGAIQRFIGGSIEEVPSRYAEGSADGLLPLGVPQQLLYSGKMEYLPHDRANWARLFTGYADKAGKAGDPVTATRMEHSGHFDGIDPHSKVWPLVSAKIQGLL